MCKVADLCTIFIDTFSPFLFSILRYAIALCSKHKYTYTCMCAIVCVSTKLLTKWNCWSIFFLRIQRVDVKSLTISATIIASHNNEFYLLGLPLCNVWKQVSPYHRRTHALIWANNERFWTRKIIFSLKNPRGSCATNEGNKYRKLDAEAHKSQRTGTSMKKHLKAYFESACR